MSNRNHVRLSGILILADGPFTDLWSGGGGGGLDHLSEVLWIGWQSCDPFHYQIVAGERSSLVEAADLHLAGKGDPRTGSADQVNKRQLIS
jgi:hypothetical protein